MKTNPVISDPKRIMAEEIVLLEKRKASLAKEIKACNDLIRVKRRALAAMS